MTAQSPSEQAAPSMARMSLWAIATQLSITLLSAGTSIIQNRTLGPDGRGAVGLMQLWPVFLGLLASAGWFSAVSACISKSPEHRRAYWSAAQLTGLVITALTCGIGWFAIPWLMSLSPELWPLARLLLLLIPLTFLAQSGVAGLEALHRYDLSSHVRVGNLLVLLVFLVPLAALHSLTPTSYCLAFLATTFLTTAYGCWLFAKTSSGSWRPQWGPLPGFVLRAAPLNWAQALHLKADQFVIGLFEPDPTEFGAYVVGTTLATMVSPIAQGLALVLLPASARRAEADAVLLFARMGRFFVLAAAVVAVPIALVAPWLLTLCYGPAFASGAYALRIGLLSAVLNGLLTMGLSTMQGTGRPGTAAVIGTVSGGAIVAAAATLLPLLGYMGAAFGQALGLLVGLILVVLAYGREGLTVVSLLPRGSDVISLWNRLTGLFLRKRAATVPPSEAPTSVCQPSAAPACDAILLQGESVNLTNDNR